MIECDGLTIWDGNTLGQRPYRHSGMLELMMAVLETDVSAAESIK